MIFPELPEIVKALGIGTGAAGITVSAYFVVQYIKVRENTKKIDSLVLRCDSQDKVLINHTKKLATIEECTENIDKNVEKLIKLHLKA